MPRPRPRQLKPRQPEPRQSRHAKPRRSRPRLQEYSLKPSWRMITKSGRKRFYARATGIWIYISARDPKGLRLSSSLFSISSLLPNQTVRVPGPVTVYTANKTFGFVLRQAHQRPGDELISRTLPPRSPLGRIRQYLIPKGGTPVHLMHFGRYCGSAYINGSEVIVVIQSRPAWVKCREFDCKYEEQGFMRINRHQESIWIQTPEAIFLVLIPQIQPEDASNMGGGDQKHETQRETIRSPGPIPATAVCPQTQQSFKILSKNQDAQPSDSSGTWWALTECDTNASDIENRGEQTKVDSPVIPESDLADI